MEAYGSLTASSLSRTVDEATDDSAARSERANGLKSFALSLGKAAVCVAIGIVVGRNGDSASASGGASTTSTSLSTASAATAAVETAALLAVLKGAAQVTEVLRRLGFSWGSDANATDVAYLAAAAAQHGVDPHASAGVAYLAAAAQQMAAAPWVAHWHPGAGEAA